VEERIAIVGGGLTAGRVVQSYRQAGGEEPITLVSADSWPPYHRPPLSKGFLRGESEASDALLEPAEWYGEHGVDLRLETLVEGVDVAARELRLEGGETVLWTRLVLASGSRPRRLDVPGADLPGVHAYRTIADAQSVRDEAERARRALVIGGGFIGMETTASLRRRGLEVTQVDLAPRLFAALGVPEVSASLERLYREQGVDVVLEDAVEEFRGDGALTGAVTKGGREIEAALAIAGIGIVPWTDYLEGSGIALDDGVVVNERFETSVPGVYGAGDVVRFHDPIFGHPRRIEHWSNANHQGTQLGRLLAGEDAPYDHVASFFTELFGTKLGVLGDPDGGFDEVVVRGSLEEGRVLAFYLRGDRLVAALVSGVEKETQESLTELLREQPRVADRSLLADEEAPPDEAFAA
jgi:3-phenylpropionate/trans-cinnamate dioxygenase ferredoxin reductase component